MVDASNSIGSTAYHDAECFLIGEQACYRDQEIENSIKDLSLLWGEISGYQVDTFEGKQGGALIIFFFDLPAGNRDQMLKANMIELERQLEFALPYEVTRGQRDGVEVMTYSNENVIAD